MQPIQDGRQSKNPPLNWNINPVRALNILKWFWRPSLPQMIQSCKYSIWVCPGGPRPNAKPNLNYIRLGFNNFKLQCNPELNRSNIKSCTISWEVRFHIEKLYTENHLAFYLQSGWKSSYQHTTIKVMVWIFLSRVSHLAQNRFSPLYVLCTV